MSYAIQQKQRKAQTQNQTTLTNTCDNARRNTHHYMHQAVNTTCSFEQQELHQQYEQVPSEVLPLPNTSKPYTSRSYARSEHKTTHPMLTTTLSAAQSQMSQSSCLQPSQCEQPAMHGPYTSNHHNASAVNALSISNHIPFPSIAPVILRHGAIPIPYTMKNSVIQTGVVPQVVQVYSPVMQTLCHINLTLEEVPHPMYSANCIINTQIAKVQQRMAAHYMNDDIENQYVQQFYANEALRRADDELQHFFCRATALTLNRHPRMCEYPNHTFNKHLAGELTDIALHAMIKSELQNIHVYHNELVNRQYIGNVAPYVEAVIPQTIETMQKNAGHILLNIYALKSHDLSFTQHILTCLLTQIEEQKQLIEMLLQHC